MSTIHRRLFHSVIISVFLLTLLGAFTLPFAPVDYAKAQDEVTDVPVEEPTEPPVVEAPTEEPTEVPTEVVTEAPTEVLTDEPTEVVTEPPAAEITEEPTVAVTEETPLAEVTEAVTTEPTEPTQSVTESPTENPTEVPTDTPVVSPFEEDFQAGNTNHWLLTAGWQLVTESDNVFLSAAAPNEIATVLNVDWEHLLFAVQARVPADNTLNVAVRAGTENYTVTLDANGQVSLYRGAALLGQGGPEIVAAPDGSEPEPVWRKLNLQALGGKIVVGVDNVVYVDYTDPAPLGPGAIVFSTGAANTGAVAIDDIVIHELELPVETLTPEPTEAPVETPTSEPIVVTPEPEITEEPVLEVTEEVLPEVTVEPEITEEPLPEVTEEPALGEVIVNEDFEGEDFSIWQFGAGAGVVAENAEDASNHVLYMEANGNLVPTEVLLLADMQMDARVKLVADAQDGTASGLQVLFRTQAGTAYVLSIENNQTALYRNDGEGSVLLASSPAAHALDVWYTLSLTVQGGKIAVMVDEAVELEYADETPLEQGHFAFVANPASSVIMDDIAVTALTPPVVPEPILFNIAEENRSKVDDTLLRILDEYVNGDPAAAVAEAERLGLLADTEDGSLKVAVIVWVAEEGQTGEMLAPMVEVTGSVIEEVKEYKVEALVPFPGLVALANLPEVGTIWLQPTISTTSSPASELPSPALAPAGTCVSEGFDVVGANAWHEAGITGSGVKIAVLDTGFQNITSIPAAEYSCLASTTPNGGTGAGTHGRDMVQIVCDVAPSAAVRMYTVDGTGSNLATQINNARSDGSKVILIPLDLGAHSTPGDGLDGGTDYDAVYTAIQNARNEGRIVIASAGNNQERYASFTYSGGPKTISFQNVTNGDKVNVSWNDWSGAAFPSFSLPGGSYSSRSIGQPAGKQLTISGSGSINLNFTNITGAGSLFVQVQIVSDTASIVDDVSFSTTAGNLARPADSPYAIAVGAVEAGFGSNFPILTNSSHGRVFASGGGNPTAVSTPAKRSEVKPDIVGPSNVIIHNTTDCTGSAGGTSAAAAHIAGAVALMVSNTNASMNAFDGTSSAAFDAVKDYLQTHAADEPFALPDGFDTTYGAGLAVLGDPNFNLTTVSNPTAAPDNLPTCSNVQFVGLANPGDSGITAVNAGNQDHPYIHPAFALQEAGAGDCVVLMPGEYTTPILMDGIANNVTLISYDGVTFADRNDSVFWTHASVLGSHSAAAINVENSTGTVIEGFTFAPSSVYQSAFFAEPQPFLVDNADNTIIRSNVVDNFDFDGSSLAEIIFGSQGTQLLRNSFNDSVSQAGLPMIFIEDSGTTTPIVVELNTFENNVRTYGDILGWESLIDISNSAVDIRSNVFNNNDAETLIHAFETEGGPFRNLRVLGNVFMDNTITTTESASNAGPLVNIENLPRLYFVNNTVVNNNISTGGLDYGAIILRGDNTLGQGSAVGGEGTWEIRNNLFYNNIMPAGLTNDPYINGDRACKDFADGSQTDNDGAQYNWFYSNLSTAPVGGECRNAITDVANNNRSDVNLNDLFLGNSGLATAPPATDPLFYALQQPATIGDPNDGINDANDAFYQAYLATAFLRDAGNKARRTAEFDGGTPAIDMGAYELQLLAVIDDPYYVGPFVEDTFPIYISSLPDNVEGGFGQLTFSVEDVPTNYGTQCGPEFAGTQGVIVVSNTVLAYCPPEDFYTQSGEYVTIGYRVTDQIGSTVPIDPDPAPVVQFQITPVLDTALGSDEKIGPYEVVANTGTEVNFRLRPYVDFDNFYFSERNNPNGTIADQVDYPFLYGNLTRQSYTGDDIFPATLTPDPDGHVSFDLTGVQGKGVGVYTYNVSDDHNLNGTAGGAGDSTMTNVEIHIRIVNLIPTQGLHDDTSFAFEYDDNWEPIYSEGNINNTLHQTSAAGATAQFQFADPGLAGVGSGFILYMQGTTKGGDWRLSVDGVELTNWVYDELVGESVDDTSLTGVNDPICVTRRITTFGNLISHKVKDAYTVSCQGLDSGVVHTVEFTNQMDKKVLQVDAFAVLDSDGDASADPPLLLGPGFHNVDTVAMREYFQGIGGWTELVDKKAVGGRALTTTTLGIFEFSFTDATGFAIGTVLENLAVPVVPPDTGAVYEVCIRQDGDVPGDTETCQKFDNAVGASRGTTWQVFRPFFGFNPALTYDVTVDLTDIPASERMVLDTIVVFNDKTSGALPLGDTEDDQRDMFVFGNGLNDSWYYDTNNKKIASRSLTSLAKKVIAAGPFISFNIPAEANTVIWHRLGDVKKDSQYMMVCVDRATGVGTPDSFGNCIRVNLRTGSYYQQNAATGDFGAETLPNIALPVGSIVIESSMFHTDWGTGGEHTIELFSLSNETFSFDRIQVYDSLDALPIGFYEEFSPGLQYFDGTLTLNGGSFVPLADRKASLGQVMSTVGIVNDEGMLFQFHGTGFSVLFTQDKFADAVAICWYRGLTTDVTTVEGGTCQEYDNQSSRIINQAGRTILGLDEDDYTVIVQMLDDNGIPSLHPITDVLSLKIDAVEIYNEAWFTSGNWDDAANLDKLIPGMRYETSYDNREVDNRFQYVGDAWTYVSGNKAKRQSGADYDLIKKSGMGEGVLFRTDGADGLLLYRDTKKNYAPIEICVAPMSGLTQVDLANRTCMMVANSGGTGYQQPYGMLFNTSGDIGPHVVTITVHGDGQFILDAIELVDTDGGVLEPGLHEDYEPALQYSADGLWMEEISSKYSGGGRMVGKAANAELIFAFTGTGFSLISQTDSNGGDIDVTLDGTGANDHNFTVSTYGDKTEVGALLTFDGLPDDTYTATITNVGASQLVVDTIQVYAQGAGISVDPTVGLFEAETAPMFGFFNAGLTWPSASFVVTPFGGASGEAVMSSTTVGSGMRFEFHGTGFSVLFAQDVYAGAVKICWVRGSESSVANVLAGTCQEYDNQSASTVNLAGRTILGLDEDDYTVAVQMLDGVSIKIDAARIYNGAWFTSGDWADADKLQVLTPGARYETSYENRDVDKLFQYTGDGWLSVSGTKAKNQSGLNYDTINSSMGAGVLFRTDNADALILYRDTKKAYAPVEVCVAPMNGGTTQVDLTNRVCTMVANDGGTGTQQPYGVLFNITGDTGPYVVTITVQGMGQFTLDAIELVDTDRGFGPLVLEPGLYEEYEPALLYSADGLWTPVHNKKYGDGRIMMSQAVGAEMTFAFNGTGFELGLLADGNGGEVEVCYDDDATFDEPAETGADQSCFIYQQETKKASVTTSRTVAGLANATYYVRVLDVEDGATVLSSVVGAPRSTKYPIGKLSVDYVRIFDDVPLPVVPAGFYSENAVDTNGDAYLQVLPAEQWSNFTDKSAKNFTNQSYTAVIQVRGTKVKASNLYAGPVAVMQVDVPSADGVTVVLYTGTSPKKNSDQMLVCADNVTGEITWDGIGFALANSDDCILVKTMRTSNQIVLSSGELDALGVVGTHVLTFRALNPGAFNIDNFQVIEGSLLVPGIYDEFLPDGLLDFEPDFNPDLKVCNQLTEWCNTKSKGSYGGFTARTQQANASLTFNMEGTGFSIIVTPDKAGVDMRVCYKLANNSTDFPASGEDLSAYSDPDLEAGEIFCEMTTTNLGDSWAVYNPDRPNPKKGSQYGFAYYGMANRQYTVEVRVIDSVIGLKDKLQIDAIAVFGDVTQLPMMTAGLYDDAEADILYGPEPFWSVNTYKRGGPPKGAWNGGDHVATNVGSLAQVYVEGNALTLYQTADKKSSSNVQICLVVSNEPIHCGVGEDRFANQTADFSQSGKKTYFSPIVFYGLGEGSHQVIFENRQHGKALSIDAIRPWD